MDVVGEVEKGVGESGEGCRGRVEGCRGSGKEWPANPKPNARNNLDGSLCDPIVSQEETFRQLCSPSREWIGRLYPTP